jgi:mRNA interferase RelE/StbE
MPILFRFRSDAHKQFLNLPRDVQARILEKLAWYEMTLEPLDFAKRLKGNKFGTYRFRIGDYRLLCDVQKNDDVIVLAVGNRKDIYR